MSKDTRIPFIDKDGKEMVACTQSDGRIVAYTKEGMAKIDAFMNPIMEAAFWHAAAVVTEGPKQEKQIRKRLNQEWAKVEKAAAQTPQEKIEYPGLLGAAERLFKDWFWESYRRIKAEQKRKRSKKKS